MSITYPNDKGQNITVYTDGLCFFDISDRIKSLPGINVNSTSNSISHRIIGSDHFTLTEGIWWIPYTYRLCVYNANEILDNAFLDITSRISIKPNLFIKLEKEIEVEPCLPSMPKEIYYDVNFYYEKEVLKLLENDIDLLDSGNLSFWKNKIQIIDLLFNK